MLSSCNIGIATNVPTFFKNAPYRPSSADDSPFEERRQGRLIRCFAWEDIEPGSYFDPEFMRQYETLGTPIHIGEGGSVTMNLKAIP